MCLKAHIFSCRNLCYIKFLEDNKPITCATFNMYYKGLSKPEIKVCTYYYPLIHVSQHCYPRGGMTLARRRSPSRSRLGPNLKVAIKGLGSVTLPVMSLSACSLLSLSFSTLLLLMSFESFAVFDTSFCIFR